MTSPPTTAAIQTPPGRGGIAVIALTGPRAEQILAEAFRPLRRAGERTGGLRLGHLLDGDRVIDEAIVAWHGRVAEINVHGGPAVVRAVLHRLARLGAQPRPAPPAATESFPIAHPAWTNPAVGEEMLCALNDARSLLVVAVLTRQWSAGISRLAREVVAARDAAPSAATALRHAADRLATMQRLLHPPEVALAGPPNVGKSTLANALVGRDVSVVHDQPGTTRDWVRELALLNGVCVYLTDTAGLWDSPVPGSIDAQAVRRARHRIQRADLVLLLGAGRRSDVPGWLQGPVLHVAAQCDRAGAFPDADAAVSAATGDGLDALRLRILQALGLGKIDPATPAAFTPRQADLLTLAADALQNDRPAAARDALTDLLEG